MQCNAFSSKESNRNRETHRFLHPRHRAQHVQQVTRQSLQSLKLHKPHEHKRSTRACNSTRCVSIGRGNRKHGAAACSVAPGTWPSPPAAACESILTVPAAVLGSWTAVVVGPHAARRGLAAGADVLVLQPASHHPSQATRYQREPE